jgi:hypothetical protein
MSRSRRTDEPPLQGSVARVFDVAFPDVKLQARARAIDAWDRVSPLSGVTPLTSLVLRHDPLAPPLALAVHDGSTVRITRALGLAGVADWTPDSLVRRTAGRVFLYRQTTAPRAVDANVGLPIPLGSELHRAQISGVGALGDFVGGSLAVGGFVETIVAVSGSDVHFYVRENNGAPQLFSAGAARLTQDAQHPALWTKVADFRATVLPEELAFGDPLPASPVTVVESYLARLSYFGRLGPAGTIVLALRQPRPVIVPPLKLVRQVLESKIRRRLLTSNLGQTRRTRCEVANARPDPRNVTGCRHFQPVNNSFGYIGTSVRYPITKRGAVRA